MYPLFRLGKYTTSGSLQRKEHSQMPLDMQLCSDDSLFAQMVDEYSSKQQQGSVEASMLGRLLALPQTPCGADCTVPPLVILTACCLASLCLLRESTARNQKSSEGKGSVSLFLCIFYFVCATKTAHVNYIHIPYNL